MKRLEYIGLKQDGERAFLQDTGIEWMPGAVHEVEEKHAEQMLRHTDVWREVPGKAATLASAARSTPQGTEVEADTLPEWVKKGIELGATDDQLEAIAQAGGPETEQGAALWKDATGTDWSATEGAGEPEAGIASKPAAKKKAAAKKPAKKAK